MAQSLALSSSTKNSEKLNQAGFNFPPPLRSYRSSSFIVQWTPHKNIFNMAAIVMDDISSDSGIFCDSKLYHSYFRYNISFTDPPLGGFGEIFPSVMIFPSG